MAEMSGPRVVGVDQASPEFRGATAYSLVALPRRDSAHRAGAFLHTCFVTALVMPARRRQSVVYQLPTQAKPLMP